MTSNQYPNYSGGRPLPDSSRTKIRAPRGWVFAVNFALGAVIILAVLLLQPLSRLLGGRPAAPTYGDL